MPQPDAGEVLRPRGTTIGLLVRRGKKDFTVAMELDDPRAPAPWPGRPARDTLLRT